MNLTAAEFTSIDKERLDVLAGVRGTGTDRAVRLYELTTRLAELADAALSPPAFNELTDSPDSYAGAEGYFLRVNLSGDGVEFHPIGAMAGTGVMSEIAAFTVTDTMLSGLREIECQFGSAGYITVPAGLTGTEPAHFSWTDGAQPEFYAPAGVELISADGGEALRAFGSSVELVPLGNDRYLLRGDTEPRDCIILEGDQSGYLLLDTSDGHTSYVELEGDFS